MTEGAVRTVSGLRRKAILATLALNVGEIVSIDRLAEIAWGDAAPSTMLNTLQSHVSYLRTVLGGKAAILARPPGYVLNLVGEGTDVRLAERLLRQAGQRANPTAAAAELRKALALWRGKPLADVTGIAWLEQQADLLGLLHQQIKQTLVEVRLASGEHWQLVPELEGMVADHPLDEMLHAQLMLALYRSGRQADALAAYQRMRIILEQLGLDPSQGLRDLETAILRQEASLSLDMPPGAVTLPSAAASLLPIPAQLPLAITAFAGRDAELASLDAILPQLAASGTAPVRNVVVSTVVGTAGVGKTALTLHWAHRVRDQFPDGQLYVNLRGFDPSEPVMDPDQALRGFLDALGVPPERVPSSMESMGGLYRSLLSGRRVLVVLDNARDTEQARPLLPGSAGCLALVTSRNQLTGLVVAEGAHQLDLDLLTASESYELLIRRLSVRRVEAERQAAQEIIASCVRLPLALTIAAVTAAARPTFSLAAISAELRQSVAALDPFDGGESATNVRAALLCSYRALSSDAARLFRLLGLHPGPDTSLAAVASLAGIPPRQARTRLAELTRAHLLSEHTPGRYAFHNLLRAFATEQAHAHEDDDSRREAIHRMLDHYLHVAQTASARLDPPQAPASTTPPRPGVTYDDVADYQQALAWFTAERPVILATVAQTPVGFGSYAWQLASAITGFLYLRGHWQDQKAANAAGLAAARRQDDRVGQAIARHGLGLACSGLRQLEDARTNYLLALELFREANDHVGQAQAHMNLAWLVGTQGRDDEALNHSWQSFRHYQAAGRSAGQAKALNNIGWHLAKQRSYEQALAYCHKALAIACEIDDRNSQAHICNSLGFIYSHLGRHKWAMDYYQGALERFRASGDLYGEATCLSCLGDVHDAVGDGGAAQRAWIGALDVLGRLDHADARQVRAKLR